MTDIEIQIDMPGWLSRDGSQRRSARGSGETVVFEHHTDWLAGPTAFP
jgi:hypothetical protein